MSISHLQPCHTSSIVETHCSDRLELSSINSTSTQAKASPSLSPALVDCKKTYCSMQQITMVSQQERAYNSLDAGQSAVLLLDTIGVATGLSCLVGLGEDY